MSLLVAIALGLALGIVTGMPLGVVNVAIVDAAAAGRPRFAGGLALGGAAADTLHSALAFLGVGRLVTLRPDLMRILAIAAAVIIGAYAVTTWRRHLRPVIVVAGESTARGVAVGASLTLPNPGALGGWVAIASATWPHATVPVAIAVAIGVGLGSAVWFTLLGRWVARIRPGHPALRFLPRIALIALVTVAGLGVLRVL